MGPEQPRLEDPVRPLHPQVPAVLAGLVLPSRLEVLADREVPGRLLLLAIQVALVRL